MKHKFSILLAALLALLLISLWIKSCQKCKDYPSKTKKGYVCPGYQEIKVQTLQESTMKVLFRPDSTGSTEKDTLLKLPDSDLVVNVKIPFECNQLIFAPSLSGPHAEDMRRYLECQGFKLERKCDCTDSLELWVYDDPGDANLIEVVKDPPKDVSGNSIGGLSLNYTVDFDSLDTKNRIPLANAEIEPNKGNPTVKIGISDSGVDLDKNNPFHKAGYLWFNSLVQTPACIDPGQYGLSILSANQEPNDMVGHGTFINGILIGAAFSNAQKQVKIPVKLELLNIKNSDASSFSVFDAICGLYFGVEQGIKLFNVSWGFLEEKSAGASEIFKMFLRTTSPDVLLVAGTGNYGNGGLTHGVSLDYNARFWPASLAETEPRVISVGALNKQGDGLASFSNFSLSPSKMNILAPGEDILSLAAGQSPTGTPLQFLMGSGTSYATPFATRIIAVIQLNNPSAEAVKSVLQNSNSTLSGIPMLGI